MDSPIQAQNKINNNRVALFLPTSAGQFRGNTVNLGDYRYNQLQILATLNNNVAAFFTWLSANGGAPANSSIHSWSVLAGIATVNLNVNTVKIWVEDATGFLHAAQLLAGTVATDTASGNRRPNNYADPSNAKVWFNKLA